MLQFDRYGAAAAYRPAKNSVYLSNVSSGWACSSAAKTRGKWYLEYVIDADNTSSTMLGIANMYLPHGYDTSGGWPAGFDFFGLYRYDNSIYHGGALAYTNAGWTTGYVIRLGVDCNNGTMFYAINGNPPAEITQYRANTYPFIIPFVTTGSSGSTFTVSIRGERNSCQYPAFLGFNYWGEGKINRAPLLVTPSIQQSLGVR